MNQSALFKTIAAALAVFFIPLALHAQAPLTLAQQHEAELAKAAAPLEKAVALDKLGRFPEALSLLRETAKATPNDDSIQLYIAIALDHDGGHAAARQIYDTLFGRIQEVQQNLARARLTNQIPANPDLDDSRLLAMTDVLDESAALNYVFLGQPDKALSMFTAIYARINVYGPDETTNRAALWRLWLTAKMRAADGMRSKVAFDTLIASLDVSTPYHKAMLKFYQGKLKWPKLLDAISSTKTDALTKERYMTEAYFFAAGYFRYVKRDNETALKLLEAQDALPYNGVVERLFIRDEIKSLKNPPPAP